MSALSALAAEGLWELYVSQHVTHSKELEEGIVGVLHGITWYKIDKRIHGIT